ncbi:hypothetical protein AB0B45_28800 [Nonomuraea sp. NPDC049152]|uniref:hypothetical protein n=1 Tax=Nonomuraea sp. NPDC049152 TaxID=3154350 RepID=UPI003409327C
MAQPPPQRINHQQLKKGAAPAFDEAGAAVRNAVSKALRALPKVAEWSTDEEVDRAFLEWFKPKCEEIPRLIREFAEVYEDCGDGLRAVQRNVSTVDWGIADDMKIDEVPVYTWPPKEAR